MFFTTDKSRIIIKDCKGREFLPLSAALHNLVHNQGWRDITIDLSDATYLDTKIMVPLVTIARGYRIEGVNFEIILPKIPNLSKLVINANWAHLITPEKFDSNIEKNEIHLSALQYRTSDDQYYAVDKCLDTILKSIPGINRKALRALEWSLSEITDNVLNHSQSPIGGVLQLIAFKTRKIIELHVCDTGIGIPETLKHGDAAIYEPVEALREAVKEGVTRNKKTNQGNGLFGAYECSRLSGGDFDITSGNASLRMVNNSLRVSKSSIPAKGTFIRTCINYSMEELLEKAFVFRGRKYDFPNDYIEKTYRRDSDDITFKMIREVASFRSRDAGKATRVKIENLLKEIPDNMIFDFHGVNVISSSFADEVYANLFKTMGKEKFRKTFKFVNMNDTIIKLISRAIYQRTNEQIADI